MLPFVQRTPEEPGDTSGILRLNCFCFDKNISIELLLWKCGVSWAGATHRIMRAGLPCSAGTLLELEQLRCEICHDVLAPQMEKMLQKSQRFTCRWADPHVHCSCPSVPHPDGSGAPLGIATPPTPSGQPLPVSDHSLGDKYFITPYLKGVDSRAMCWEWRLAAPGGVAWHTQNSVDSEGRGLKWQRSQVTRRSM